MVRFFVAALILACSILSAVFVVARQPKRGPQAPDQAASAVYVPVGRGAAVATLTMPSDQGEGVLPEPHPFSVALCPTDMVWVGGKYCPKRRDGEDRDSGCVSGERTIAVCMDPHEYPSQAGVWPAVMLDYETAAGACKAERKRLCTETEWSFACASMRDVEGCNTGRTELTIRTQELARAERISGEIAARDGRRPSSENACVNAFRVFDLLGNVQEWVISEHRTPHVGALKGGRYNQSSIGCDRSIYVSDPWTRYPHTGLRCCADPLAPAPTSP